MQEQPEQATEVEQQIKQSAAGSGSEKAQDSEDSMLIVTRNAPVLQIEQCTVKFNQQQMDPLIAQLEQEIGERSQ